MQKDVIRGKSASSSTHHCKIPKKEFTISELRQVVAEARGLTPTGYGIKPNEEAWIQARSIENKEREAIAEYVNEKIR